MFKKYLGNPVGGVLALLPAASALAHHSGGDSFHSGDIIAVGVGLLLVATWIIRSRWRRGDDSGR